MQEHKCITSTKKNRQKRQPESQITFILLCDMPGYRMKSYGAIPLLNIENKKLIDIQIETINNKFPNSEIIVCTGFESEIVCRYVKLNHKKHKIRIVENQIFNHCNSCESLRLCLNNAIENKIFIIDGSLLLYEGIFDEFDLSTSCLMVESNPHSNLEIGVNINENNLVEHFSFGTKNIWSEIMFLSDTYSIECLSKILSNIDFKNKLVFEALNELIKYKCKLKYVVNKKQLVKLNNIKTIKELRIKI
jgi:hypothetical protein